MTILKSSVNPHDPNFVQNHNNMSALVDDLRSKAATIRLGGGVALKERHPHYRVRDITHRDRKTN